MPRAIVIYDADCGFCKWCLAILLRAADRGPAGTSAFHPLPLGTAEADRLLADLTVAERQASWHLVTDAGSVNAPAAPAPRRVSAGAALAPALSLVAGGRVPAALFRRLPGIAEGGYRWVADHRGLLGRFVPGRARRWADRVIAAHGEVPQ